MVEKEVYKYCWVYVLQWDQARGKETRPTFPGVWVSTRAYCRVGMTSVLCIPHRNMLNPYYVSFHQDLYGNNFENRVNFCT
ncbi:hypothetical protein PR048_011072 [Dryococelus australis]|uniref:Uncharacterized protein n=1 Tax=Dryococelus australis TaxID=614101 RepID=A0ABQ9HKL7_9NEOP|nr:hypothetical protein PR048_011072 [Dryococelus australis]